jgi:prepilin-type N-terminal cleavage/methylation domain-containing protein
MTSIFKKTKTRSLVKGFTIIEVLVSIAVFLLMMVTIYQVALTVSRGIKNFRDNTVVSSLADQYLEIARNLPYSQIGTFSGNPHGNLPDLPNSVTEVINDTSYNIYYVVNYIDDPADGTILAGTDAAPNDYKQIKLYVEKVSTGITSSFLTNIAPKGLEGSNNGGALLIKVFDAVGQPVAGATVHITNTAVSPSINLTRTSDSAGNWVEVGLPASANSYHVVVTKNNYSSDQTYPISVSNPNPTKPDATILAGTVTQISFSIDKTSNLTFNILNQFCSPLNAIGLDVRGSKIIGTPNVLKFDNSYNSDTNGQVTISNIEWDNYVPAINSNTYMIYGSSPIQQISVLPNTSQTYTFILGNKTANSLLVIVKDSSTSNPIEGASVTLNNGDPDDDITKLTAGSIWNQDDWSGGDGQQNFTDVTKYSQDDDNLDYAGVPLALRLVDYGDQNYASSGTLTSSSFDTGTNATAYTSLTWNPTSQDPATTLKFQIATNNDNATWNYVGPDGTSGSYFTVPGTTINVANGNNRYIRYKVFMSTTDSTKTPVLTSVGINYVVGCFTPGQAMFPGLNSNKTYQVQVSMPGYSTQTISDLTVSGYQTLEVLLTP